MNETDYMKRLRESFDLQLDMFIKGATREYEKVSEPTRKVNVKNNNDIKKWMEVDNNDDEKEYEKRREGLQALFEKSIRQIFDYLRWSSGQCNTGNNMSAADTVTTLSESSSFLKYLLWKFIEILDFEDGSYSLEGCLDGSLLVKEHPVDSVNGEVPTWILSGYESSLIILKHFGMLGMTDPRMYEKMKKSTTMQGKRIVSPSGASKLSRFSEPKERIQSLGGGIIREARCFVRAIEVPCNGIDVDGDILALSGSCGYKHRSPWFGAIKLPQTSRNAKTFSFVPPFDSGFYEPGCTVVCSQELQSVACVADQRIKIFDMSKKTLMPCTATLQAKYTTGEPLFIGNKIIALSNRSNEIHQWNFQNLQEHEPLTLRDVQDDDSQPWLDLTESSWNDDIMDEPENIDVNIGESPHLKSQIKGLPNTFQADTLVKNKASTSDSFFLGSLKDPSMYLVDANQSKVTHRFLGHLNMGRSDLKISTSAQVPNLVLSTRNDQHTRMWDLRCKGDLPVMTLNHSNCDRGSDSSCLAEDMLAFTSGGDQCIRTWDLRAPACLYKLSTGNTEVDDLQYSFQTKSLFATVQGFGCKKYFPPKYFLHEWNAYTQGHTMAMQHRADGSHLLIYDFKDSSLDVNSELPVDMPRADSDAEDEDNYW